MKLQYTKPKRLMLGQNKLKTKLQVHRRGLGPYYANFIKESAKSFKWTKKNILRI
jgi:hypothetical protein